MTIIDGAVETQGNKSVQILEKSTIDSIKNDAWQVLKEHHSRAPRIFLIKQGRRQPNSNQASDYKNADQ